jgi:hypothetical protein
VGGLGAGGVVASAFFQIRVFTEAISEVQLLKWLFFIDLIFNILEDLFLLETYIF